MNTENKYGDYKSEIEQSVKNLIKERELLTLEVSEANKVTVSDFNNEADVDYLEQQKDFNLSSIRYLDKAIRNVHEALVGHLGKLEDTKDIVESLTEKDNTVADDVNEAIEHYKGLVKIVVDFCDKESIELPESE